MWLLLGRGDVGGVGAGGMASGFGGVGVVVVYLIGYKNGDGIIFRSSVYIMDSQHVRAEEYQCIYNAYTLVARPS